MNDLLLVLNNSPIFWVIIVGLIAGFLSNAKNERPKSFKQRVAHFITGAISSTFLCWIAFEIAFFYTTQQNISLAIGGFFAWRGADWATAIVDKFIDNKLGKSHETDNNEI